MDSYKIFISYRRADSQWAAARLYDTLSAAFPDDQIFMDVEQIAPGQDFVDVLEDQVGECDVFLALIGPEWLALQSPKGERRLDDVTDFVRIEIASALQKSGTITIPVLLDGAAPPEPEDLPEDLRALARRQFARLTHEGYRDESRRLVDAIDDVFETRTAARGPGPSRLAKLRKPAGVGIGVVAAAALGWFAYDRITRPADPSGTPDLATFKECELCPEMVALPGGSFMMGSPESEPNRFSNEGPQREVTITRFAMGKTEITYAEYSICLAEGACPQLPDDGTDRTGMPQTNVSWSDAQDYIAWLNEQVPGEPYRLPTESEWEYAARGGTTTAYYWGDDWDRAYANMGREVCCIGVAEGPDKWRYDAPVGQFPPNPFGLYDMAGNLAEWVEDVYTSDIDKSPTDGSPRIWISDSPWAQRHAIRGGSYGDRPWGVRSAVRSSNDKNWRLYEYGFRVARDMTPR